MSENAEIGLTATLTRRRTARRCAAPIHDTPFVAKTRARKSAAPGGQSENDIQSDCATGEPINQIGGGDASGDDGQTMRDTHSAYAAIPHTGGHSERGTQEIPAPADTETAPAKARRSRASPIPPPINRAPGSNPSPGQTGGRDGQKSFDDHSGDAVAATTGESPRGRAKVVATTPNSGAPAPDNIAHLVMLQRKRKFAIRAQSQIDRSIEALIASILGFRIDATEKDRKAVFARAKAHRLAIEKGKASTETGAIDDFLPMILASAASRSTWDTIRADTEKEMEAQAKHLPIYAWSEGVRGLGAKGIAIIAAEAGISIGDYRTISGLWKRMGLAVIGGRAQRRVKDKAGAIEQGYSPRRRSEIWTLADSMFRSQWAGERLACACDTKPQRFKATEGGPVCAGCGCVGIEGDIIPAHPAGPYGEVFARRRAATNVRIALTADLDRSSPDKWTAMRCHRDAVRIMSKALLADIWREWRRATDGIDGQLGR